MRKMLSWVVAAALLLTVSAGVGATEAMLQAPSNQVQAKTLASTAGSWKSSAGKWWYAYNGGGYASDGWQKISGAWYHFDKAGWMETGWLKDGGSWYYLASSGAMQTGWVRVGGAWYYMNSSGIMTTGWQKVGGTWYLLGSNGAMKTDWQKLGNAWYYLYPSGAMACNAWVGNYWLGSTGAMVTNDWVDGGKYYVGPNGEWDQTAKPGSNKPGNSSSTKPGNSSNNKPSNTGLAYSYEMQVLNPSKLYTGQPVILYLKTNNPNPQSIEIESDDGVPVQMLICEPYDDVRLEDPDAEPSFLQELASGSGYIATVSLEATGSHGLRVLEYKYESNASKPYSRTYTNTLTSLNLYDYNATLNAWMDSMLATYTNSRMLPTEKMEALCKAFDGEEGMGLFRFDPIIYLSDESNPEDWRFARLISKSKPFFESYTWDSRTAPTIMCEFAQRIGGFDKIHNCYYDYPEKTPGWDEVHYFCQVDYQGETLMYEACPDYDTNVVSVIDYLDL